MTNHERVQFAQEACVKAAALLHEVQDQNSQIWIHSRVNAALQLVRKADAALEALSQDLLGCGNNSDTH